ncbi:MAG: DUF3224 domain-containing protein [Burkholderiaceae bacterium]|nr:DUF3224 domain-containing protein [Burkholderiaceae bacterium]
MTTTSHAAGTFEVKLIPQTPEDSGAGAPGRMLIDKQFQGDLSGSSKGQMLAVRSAVPGSAGYVAMELVTGTLAGRSGTFALQHSGSMDRGASSLSIHVVADSATGQLMGLSGKMDIKITDGQHFYTFDYLLPALA